MRYAMIMAGGTGTRLWPMSRARIPKQLIPFIGGKSLLQIASERLDGLVEAEHRFICAGAVHQQAILDALPKFTTERYLAEPTGRDTLAAVAFSAAVIGRHDPDAVMAVFTADHIIEPIDQFQHIVEAGFQLAEQNRDVLVTFGIKPTHAATGYGYLELGPQIEKGPAKVVACFKEKPNAPTAQDYLEAGPDSYLWNSGMFVWRAATCLDCVRRFAPEHHAAVMKIADAWDTPKRQEVVAAIYPTLKKISVDYAIMEPASQDQKVTVAAVPMPLFWLDVGSWPAFAQTIDKDESGNAVAADRQLLMDCSNTLVASSDKEHLIATIGCRDLIIVHTNDATLVCHADRAEDIKKIHALVGDRFGNKLV